MNSASTIASLISYNNLKITSPSRPGCFFPFALFFSKQNGRGEVLPLHLHLHLLLMTQEHNSHPKGNTRWFLLEPNMSDHDGLRTYIEVTLNFVVQCGNSFMGVFIVIE